MLAASEGRGPKGAGADVDEAYRAMVVHFALCEQCERAGAELAALTALCQRGEVLRVHWERLEFADPDAIGRVGSPDRHWEVRHPQQVL